MRALGWLTFAFILLIPGMLLRGFVLGKLWLWFVVSTFGLHPLTSAQAYGLALLVGLAVLQLHSNDSESKTDGAELVIKLLVSTFLPSLLFLLFGRIVVTFWL
jgi:hypothetical protein